MTFNGCAVSYHPESPVIRDFKDRNISKQVSVYSDIILSKRFCFSVKHSSLHTKELLRFSR